MGVLLSELWNAWALPWKLAAIEGGMCRSAAVLLDRRHRRADGALGARLKLSVTDGNWPWWLIASGAVEVADAWRIG